MTAYKRRGSLRIQDHGPAWESHTPAAGCNSTHVAKSRRAWKRRKNRTLRRTGKVSPKVWIGKPLRLPSKEAAE